MTEALLPALVAVLLAETGDSNARAAAGWHGRWRAALGMVAALLVVFALAGVGAATVAPMLVPEARALLLAVALLLAAAEGVRMPRAPAPSAGGLVDAGAATLARGLGARGQFLAFAIGAWAGPAGGAIGGAIGGVAVALLAWLIGPDWRRLPTRAIRWGSAAAFAVPGAVLLVRALRLF